MSGVYKDPDYMKNYRKRNRPKRNEYLREWRKKNPDRIRGYQLKINYGLSFDQFQEMVSVRNSCCDLCGKEKKLHVDHCHQTGKVRGLLCGPCNKALGVLGDSIESLEKVVRYLNG